MVDEQLKTWLVQAKADLLASASGGDECHRRYWLQQACEKGIKALGLMLWQGGPDEERIFRRVFLHDHSPLQRLSTESQSQPALPASLKSLLRRLEGELRQLDGEGLLRKVDQTTPTKDPANVSYRYPFADEQGKFVAPCQVSAMEWDAYQGNFQGISAAIVRFLNKLENQSRKRNRGFS